MRAGRARAASAIEPLHPALPDRELGQRPAEHHGYAMRGVALQLRLQVGGHERRAPAELDDVDARAGDLQQTVHLGDRKPAVDHVRQPPLARLDGALRYVEEIGYGAVAALSRPTIDHDARCAGQRGHGRFDRLHPGNARAVGDALGVGAMTGCILHDRHLVGPRRPAVQRRRPRVAAFAQFSRDPVRETAHFRAVEHDDADARRGRCRRGRAVRRGHLRLGVRLRRSAAARGCHHHASRRPLARRGASRGAEHDRDRRCDRQHRDRDRHPPRRQMAR